MSNLIEKIVKNRIGNFDENFINPSIKHIKSTSCLTNSREAANKIIEFINNNKKILLFTDYDVDGCTSMAILYKTIVEIIGYKKDNVVMLTGDREVDGYGLTDNIVNKIIELSPGLVITADCGTSDSDRIDKLSKNNIGVIVTDHHDVPDLGVPQSALFVVNPKQDSKYDSNIAGCGVAWLLMSDVVRQYSYNKKQQKEFFSLLDYVAVGTVADMVSLKSLTNRFFVKKGLEFINDENGRECWKAASKKIDTEFISFYLGPNINASSRMTNSAQTAINFLTLDEPKKYYKQLTKLNNERKKIEKEMTERAEKEYLEIEQCLIYYSKDNFAGVQGIVAGKLMRKLNVPCIILSGNEKISGSGRSEDIHIREALNQFNLKFPDIISFGGHKAAAGLSLSKKNLDLFLKEMPNILYKMPKLNEEIFQDDGELNSINIKTYYELQKCAPYGMGFSQPLFTGTMIINEIKIIGKTKEHLSMILDGIKAVCFFYKKLGKFNYRQGDKINIKYRLNLNYFAGRTNLQLMIEEIF